MTAIVARCLLVMVWLTAALSGCALFGDRPAYHDSGETRPLEVPPDLTVPAIDSRMNIPPLADKRVSALKMARQARQATPSGNVRVSMGAPTQSVLPDFPNMRVHHQGGVRWLEVDADPAVLWPQLKAFWRQTGFDLVRSNPRLGIMQTNWVESDGDAPPGVPLRDTYRLRLERGDDDTTDVYITHRVVAQVKADGRTRWELQPSDPELEAEYLTRLMAYLGEPRQQAERALAIANGSAAAMHLDRVAGIPVLVVKEQFRNVWPLTGVALDRAGLPVESEDVTEGTYYFRYQPVKNRHVGVLTALPGAGGGANLDKNGAAKLDKDGHYQIHLLDQPGQTLITAQAAKHKSLPPIAAEEILERLITSMQAGVDARTAGTLSTPSPDGA
ncbi:MAG: outer membrane protein assembly factor BamC [Pseudomonadota bacterium]|nr:outer membrane protein assembly factor BamC [Pseudomonadota bacterium]